MSEFNHRALALWGYHAVRDQFAGDISDLLKFSLLRALAGSDKRLGIGWYFVAEHNNRPDGRHREFCEETKWEALDKDVWNGLRDLKRRSVGALEGLQFWPGKPKFHREPIQLGALRQSWFKGMNENLAGTDLVFLDPDNGLGRNGKLHATIVEIKEMRGDGRAVVLIKFPGHVQHDKQAWNFHRLLTRDAGAKTVLTIATVVIINKTPRVRWFTILDADEKLTIRANSFVKRLNSVRGCKAYFVPRLSGSEPRSTHDPILATGKNRNKKRVCPECEYRFRGNGFDGIDAHWKARHQDVMPYPQAWPLIKAGKYQRHGLAS